MHEVAFGFQYGTACFSFSKPIFAFQSPAHSSIVFNSCQHSYIILGKCTCFLINQYEDVFRYLVQFNFIALFGPIRNTYKQFLRDQQFIVCCGFYQVCQLFSINIASVFILVKFKTVHPEKNFSCMSYFVFHCCGRPTNLLKFF